MPGDGEQAEPPEDGGDEAARQAEYERLTADGMSEAEARATVWPVGEGTGDAPAADAPAERPPPPMQIALPGDWTLISGEFGGEAPTTSEIRLLGGKMPIDGSFAKGTELDLIVRVKVTGVLGQDTVNAWGETKGTIRRHMARMISVRRLKT